MNDFQKIVEETPFWGPNDECYEEWCDLIKACKLCVKHERLDIGRELLMLIVKIARENKEWYFGQTYFEPSENDVVYGEW